MVNQSVMDNLTLAETAGLRPRVAGSGHRRPERAAEKWIRTLAVKCRGPGPAACRNSPGAPSRRSPSPVCSEHPARIFLLDEPTRGHRRRQQGTQIYQLIADLAAAGKSVLIASSYLPEHLGLCDTIGVMCRGRLAAGRPRGAWTEADILRAATGAKS